MDTLAAILARTTAVKPPQRQGTDHGAAADPVSGAVVPHGSWLAAVGSRIAARAEPLSLERGVLGVRVTNAAWANELAMLSEDILTQLRNQGIEVTSLRFRVGPLQRPTGRPRFKRAVPDARARIPETLAPVVERVEDENLRAAIREAAAKSLSLRNAR